VEIKNYYIFVERFKHENETYHPGCVVQAKPAGKGVIRIEGEGRPSVPEKYIRPLEPDEACTEAALRGAYDTISNLREFGFKLDWEAAETIAKFIEAAFVHLDGGDAIESLMKAEVPENKCPGGFLEVGLRDGNGYEAEHDVVFYEAPNGNIWAKTDFEKPEDIPDMEDGHGWC
jgi:hypothetical protein